MHSMDKVCSSNEQFSDVSNQMECQDKCRLTDSCVGIVYSDTVQEFCITCNNEVLDDVGNNFSFYKRPGITII